MGHVQLLNLLQGKGLLNKLSFYDCLKFLQQKSCCYTGKIVNFQKQYGVRLSLQGSWEVVDHVENSFSCKANIVVGRNLHLFPHVQTLRGFPKEELAAKVVMVRFDSNILLKQGNDQRTQSFSKALLTIKYLHEAGAKIVLVSDWNAVDNSELDNAEYVADLFSSILQLEVFPAKFLSHNTLRNEVLGKADILLLENLSDFKEDTANCSKFAELLSSLVDIFVNDSFSQSHKVLASTVGVTRFCYACMAGFHFEESLHLLNKVAEPSGKPYAAIFGGGNLNNKAAALHSLATRCEGLIFVGMMAFQIMHALGLPLPLSFVEQRECGEALNMVQLARDRNVQILYPKDFWCENNSLPGQLELFPAHDILDGWIPVDLGPLSLDEIGSFLAKCKQIVWIGPAKFSIPSMHVKGGCNLAKMLGQLSQNNCHIIVIGKMASQAAKHELGSLSDINIVENASAVWEFLKRRKLPGVMALDRAYPSEVNWNDAYSNPAQPLVVDIGSGNGIFLLQMARRRKDLNYLGLEINEKLVRRCLDTVHQSGITNGYFIATDATSTFCSIISTYPGDLVLVCIQCPNPDFNRPVYRWSMVQRSLVEAIVNLLSPDGKVFLQSDVEAVAMRMKALFLTYGKARLNLVDDQGGWLGENPFGVRSDWERHVLDRGKPMYRLLFSKLAGMQ